MSTTSSPRPGTSTVPRRAVHLAVTADDRIDVDLADGHTLAEGIVIELPGASIVLDEYAYTHLMDALGDVHERVMNAAEEDELARTAEEFHAYYGGIR